MSRNEADALKKRIKETSAYLHTLRRQVERGEEIRPIEIAKAIRLLDGASQQAGKE